MIEMFTTSGDEHLVACPLNADGEGAEEDPRLETLLSEQFPVEGAEHRLGREVLVHIGVRHAFHFREGVTRFEGAVTSAFRQVELRNCRQGQILRRAVFLGVSAQFLHLDLAVVTVYTVSRTATT